MAKIESVSGTAETLAAADAPSRRSIRTSSPTSPPSSARSLNEDLSPAGVAAGRKLARMPFSVEAKSNGSTDDGRHYAADRPAAAPAVPRRGTTAPTSPTSRFDQLETATIEIYFGRPQHLLTGAMGTFTLEGEAGRYGRFNFESPGCGTIRPTWRCPRRPTRRPSRRRSRARSSRSTAIRMVIGRFSFDMGIQITSVPT